MQLNKGFVGFSILIAIVLGLIVVGGGAYFVMQKNSPSPTLSDNTLDNSQTLPTTNSQTQTTQQPNTQTSATAPSTGRFQSLGLGQTIGAATAGYTRDAAGIYTLGLNGRGPKVTGADSNTFEVNTAWPIYARDNTHVYVYGEIISGADPKTFVAVCGYSMQLESFCAYGKDTKSVYAYTQVVPNANPATFVSLVSNNDTNKNNAGKSWIGGAIDASAYYGGYVPSQYGDLSSKLSGVRVSKLSDGTSIHFSDTSKVVAINLNTSIWGGYYEGVKVGSKSYYGGAYLVDGASVYTLYSACDVDSAGKESNCTFKISRVSKVGDRPSEAMAQTSSSAMQTYTNSQYKFMIQYPDTVQVTDKATYSNPLTGTSKGTDLFQATYKGDTVDVLASADANNVAKCASSNSGGTVTIGGVAFSSDTVSDSGAGQQITITWYEMLHGSMCYTIIKTMTGVALSHLAGTELQQEQVARNQISTVLDSIVQSFRFAQ